MKREIKLQNGSVETWYDRRSRNWVTQLKDKWGYQVGSAEYSGTKAGAEFSAKHLSKNGDSILIAEGRTTKPKRLKLSSNMVVINLNETTNE